MAACHGVFGMSARGQPVRSLAMLSHGFRHRAILASLFLATRTAPPAARAAQRRICISERQADDVANPRRQSFRRFGRVVDQLFFLALLSTVSLQNWGGPPAQLVRLQAKVLVHLPGDKQNATLRDRNSCISSQKISLRHPSSRTQDSPCDSPVVNRGVPRGCRTDCQGLIWFSG